MQNSGPAAQPGPKFRPGGSFCGTIAKSAGLISGSGEATTIYYTFAVGLRVMLEICRLGFILGPPDFVRRRFGLRFSLWRNVYISGSGSNTEN